jgi:GT2 family glycosyltransferase
VRFSVVIPTFGRPALLKETLEALYACEPSPDEILVVDGHPELQAEEVAVCFAARAAPPELRYITSEKGVTKQRNIGIDAAIGDVVVFADDDVRFEPNVFAVLGEAYRDPCVIGATGKFVDPPSRRIGGQQSLVRRLLLAGGAEGSFTRFGYPRYVQDLDRRTDVEVMPGGFMSARWDAARTVRFDERLGGYALAEDEDFSYRLSRRGRVRYLPEAVVVHRKTGFSAQNQRAFGRMVVVNRTYLFRKNFRRTLLARLQFGLLIILLIGHRLVNREWMGALGLVEGSMQVWRKYDPLVD